MDRRWLKGKYRPTASARARANVSVNILAFSPSEYLARRSRGARATLQLTSRQHATADVDVIVRIRSKKNIPSDYIVGAREGRRAVRAGERGFAK